MSNYDIVEQIPPVGDFIRLRELVGWGGFPEEVAAPALARSLYGVCALADGVVVGMARVVGDAGLKYYVEDVVVDPVFQGRGIGAALMDHVMAYLRAHACPGAAFGLMAARGKEGFYERYGFSRRPNERLGAGMTLFVPRE